jgi:N-acetylglucosamine kinase-like BadF-type ATPase
LKEVGITIDQVSGAGFGVAGYDWPSEREPTLERIRTLGLKCPFEMVNDAIIGLLAGACDGWGVVIIAGTSNNCRGWDRNHNEGRITGNGTIMGEYGGAYEVVLKSVHAVAAAWTLRGPKTRLTQTFIEITGAKSEEDLLEGLSMQKYNLNAEAARLVFRDAIEHKDPVAREVIQWAGRELGSLAVGVIHQLEIENERFDIVQAGSLHDGGPLLIDAIRETIHATAPGARLVRLTAPPVVGGVLLGMEQAGKDTRPIYDNLVNTAATLFTSNTDHSSEEPKP